MTSGSSHPDIALYRLCKEFNWDPRWVDEQQIQVKICGKTVFTLHYPGIAANIVNRLILIQSIVDEETAKMMKDVDPTQKMSPLARLRLWRLKHGS